MSTTGIAAFDSTIHTTNAWLHEVMDRLGWQDKQRAYQALRVVLQALRDHLPVEQAAALGAQLPLLVRGFYYEGWHPAGTPIKERKREQLLAHIATAFHNDPDVNPEEVARAVFEVIGRHVTPGEVKHVQISLPQEIRALLSEATCSLWF